MNRDKKRFKQIEKNFKCPHGNYIVTYMCDNCEYFYEFYSMPHCIQTEIKHFVEYKEGF